MPFDFLPETGSARAHRGRRSHHAGLAAEDGVARDYERRGYRPMARRWRGSGGEIDLIFADGEGLVFVEVKASATHAQAYDHFTPAQFGRILRSGEEFAALGPRGLATEVRYDLALVDGQGRIEVIEALMP